MKRWFLLTALICLILTVPLLACAGTSGSCGSSAAYTLDDDGLLTISGKGLIENYAFMFGQIDGIRIKKVVIDMLKPPPMAGRTE